MSIEVTGLWLSADGDVRQALLPNGRYVEMRATVAHQGDYWIEGLHITYRDDNGDITDGHFTAGELHVDGTIMHEQE